MESKYLDETMYVHDDMNLDNLGMLRGTFLLDAVQLMIGFLYL